MIPGIGFSAFVPKVANYADITLRYKWTKLQTVYSSSSYAYFTMPAYTVGDVIVIMTESVIDGTLIASAGYTKCTSIAGNGTTHGIYYRIVDAGSNSFSFGLITGHLTFYYCVYTNVDLTNPINVFATSKQDTTTTSLNAPAVLTTRNKCLVINSTGVRYQNFMGNGASSWSNSYLSSFAEICDYAGDLGGVVVATGFMAVAGNTGITTFYYATSTPATSITIALNPKEL